MKLFFKPRRPIKLILISLFFGVGVYLVGIVSLTDVNLVWSLTRGLSINLWVQVLALAFLSYGLRFWRWHRLLLCLGFNLPIGRNLIIYLSAFALTLTPAKLGETIRSFYLYHMGVSYHHSLAAFVGDRLMDFVVVCILALVTLSLFPDNIAWFISVLMLAALFFALLYFSLPALLLRRILQGFLVNHILNLLEIISYLLSFRVLLPLLPIGFFAWSAQGVALYFVVDAMGHHLVWYWCVSIYALSILAGVASFIPGGIGAAEATMSLLLMATGMDLAAATSTVLIVRVSTLWVAIGIGSFSILWLTFRTDSVKS